MTKDEAIRLALDALNSGSPIRKVRAHEVKDLITVLAAVGVLRLDEQPKATGVGEPWEPQRSQVCRLMHPEHGTHAFLWKINGGIGVWKLISNVLPDHDAMTPAWAWENGWRFVDELRTGGHEWPPTVHHVTAAPKRCEPPPDHIAKRWHWLQLGRPGPCPELYEWDVARWLFDGEVITPVRMAALGFSYVAPGLPPEEKA